MLTEHPDWMRLLDLAEGRAAQDPDLSEHMAACHGCRERLEQVRAFVRILEDARMEDVPGELVQRTLERICAAGVPVGEISTSGTGEALRELIGSATRSLRELVAELIADSRTPSPALRGAAPSEAVMLRYRCEAYEVTLSVSPRTGSRPGMVTGQVVPLDVEALEPGGWAELSGSSLRTRAMLSEFGEFRIEAEVPGAGEVLIRTGDDLVRVPLPSDLG